MARRRRSNSRASWKERFTLRQRRSKALNSSLGLLGHLVWTHVQRRKHALRKRIKSQLSGCSGTGRKPALSAEKWKGFFLPDGRLGDGGDRLLNIARRSVCYTCSEACTRLPANHPGFTPFRDRRMASGITFTSACIGTRPAGQKTCWQSDLCKYRSVLTCLSEDNKVWIINLDGPQKWLVGILGLNHPGVVPDVSHRQKSYSCLCDHKGTFTLWDSDDFQMVSCKVMKFRPAGKVSVIGIDGVMLNVGYDVLGQVLLQKCQDIRISTADHYKVYTDDNAMKIWSAKSCLLYTVYAKGFTAYKHQGLLRLGCSKLDKEIYSFTFVCDSTDLLESIFQKIPVPDLFPCRLVCSRWRDIAGNIIDDYLVALFQRLHL